VRRTDLGRAIGLGLLLSLSGERAAEAAEQAVVDLRPKASVRGNFALLGDIAALRAPEALAIGDLAEIRIARVPAPGRTRPIGRAEVRAALAAAGFGEDRVAIAGAEQCVIETELASLGGQALAAAARGFVEAELAPFLGEDELEIGEPTPPPPPEVQVPLGRTSSLVRVRWLGNGPPAWGAPARVEVVIEVDREVQKRLAFALALRRFSQAVVASRPISRGETIEAGSIELRRVEIVSEAERPLRAIGAAAGRLARRPIRAGMPLFAQDLAEPPLVKKGDLVAVVLRRGALEIVGHGVAARDGARGETIPVHLPESRDLVYARVIEAGRLEIPMDLSEEKRP
jgi:flagella basal body P-ring formation protein FlgA